MNLTSRRAALARLASVFALPFLPAIPDADPAGDLDTLARRHREARDAWASAWERFDSWRAGLGDLTTKAATEEFLALRDEAAPVMERYHEATEALLAEIRARLDAGQSLAAIVS